MTTLDEVFRERGRLDMLKIDTDGFDFEVLRGGVATLRRDGPVLFFEFDPRLVPEAERELEWLQGLGYQTVTCFTPDGDFAGTTDRAAEAVALARTHRYCDVLACRTDSSAAERIAALGWTRLAAVGS
jgi:hypothetical protein